MRGRLIAIAIVLGVLAFAEIGNDDPAPTAQRDSNAAFGQVGDQPAPEPPVPAIIAAAVNISATVQTGLVVASNRQLRPSLSVFAVSLRRTAIAHSTGKPLFFPLLI